MTDLTILDDLYRHMEWADAEVWQVTLATETAPRDERLRFLLHHVHIVQLAFRQVWDGAEIHVPDLDSFADLAALCRWGRERHAALHAFRDGLDTADLASEPELPWAAKVSERIGQPAETATLGETMVQVALHTVHHRGQICTFLRELGATPPLIDFIAWAWRGKPDADWPA